MGPPGDKGQRLELRLHGESKALSIYNAAEEGSGTERPIIENMGNVLDGAWHKLCVDVGVCA